MTDQLEKAKEFVNSITRDLNLVPRHNGFDLESKLSGKRFGFVRYNVDGENKERYCVYADGTFDDPEKNSATKNSLIPEVGSTCFHMAILKQKDMRLEYSNRHVTNLDKALSRLPRTESARSLRRDHRNDRTDAAGRRIRVARPAAIVQRRKTTTRSTEAVHDAAVR